jgi:hypothetical protein
LLDKFQYGIPQPGGKPALAARIIMKAGADDFQEKA